MNTIFSSILSSASILRNALSNSTSVTQVASIFTSASLFGYQNILLRMHRTGPIKKVRPARQPLDGNPFLKGVILKTLIKKPKKPNSANRKCVLVKLSNGKELVSYVPGIGHNLQILGHTFFIDITHVLLEAYAVPQSRNDTMSLGSIQCTMQLQEHQIVLCRVGRLKDVPGVKIKCVRGKYDLPHVKQ